MENKKEEMDENKKRIKQLQRGSIYRHFKGDKVIVLSLAVSTETAEEMVVYIHLKNKMLFVRPKEMFMSEVDRKKYPDVNQKYRFEYISHVDSIEFYYGEKEVRINLDQKVEEMLKS